MRIEESLKIDWLAKKIVKL